MKDRRYRITVDVGDAKILKPWHKEAFSLRDPNVFYSPLTTVAKHQHQLISRFTGWATVRGLVSFTLH